MVRCIGRIVAVGVSCAVCMPWVAAAAPSKQTDRAAPYQACIDRAAVSYNIAPGLLKAIVRVENGSWNPWSVSINRNGRGFPQSVTSYAQAVDLVSRLWKQHQNFDVGLSQVNTVNMERLRVHPVYLLDPCTNLHYAARILRELFDRYGYSWTAIERYNGHNPRYPWKVYDALRELPQ